MAHEAIHVTDADRSLIERHQLGPSQQALLQAQRQGVLLGTLGLVLTAVATVLLLVSLLNPELLPRELRALLIAVGCVWVWRLRCSPRRWFEIGSDLCAGDVAWVEGPVTGSATQSWGIVRVSRYRVHVGDRTFDVDRDDFAQFRFHSSYRVFYAPRSGCFVGAVLGGDAAPESTAQLTDMQSQSSTLARERSPSLETSTPVAPAEASGLPTSSELTQRELSILALIAVGYSNQAIADELSLSVNTVKMYCSGIYQKLGVRRRTEAVAVARRRGLLKDKAV